MDKASKVTSLKLDSSLSIIENGKRLRESAFEELSSIGKRG